MFGRYAIADKRDYKAEPLSKKITPKYWRSNWFGDQKHIPACVGFAWVHWLEAVPHRQFLNPIGVYNLCKHFDEWEGTNYDGTSVRAGAKVLRELGFLKTFAFFEIAEEVAQFVSNNGPVVVGVNLYRGMLQPNEKGQMTLKGKRLGGHAMLVDGVKPGWVRIKNSWSRKWAKRGRAWLSFKDLQRLLDEDGEACSGVEIDVNAIIR